MPEFTAAEEAVGGAYNVLHFLPANPDEAEAALAMLEHALHSPAAKRDGWTGEASYAFAHLRKRTPETAAAILAVARDVIQAVRPRYAALKQASRSHG